MVWPHPLIVIQYIGSSYYYNNVYLISDYWWYDFAGTTFFKSHMYKKKCIENRTHHYRWKWDEGGANAHDCHHLYVSVLLRTIYHNLSLKIEFLHFFIENITGKYMIYRIVVILRFLDMKIMSGRNDGDSVNNDSYLLFSIYLRNKFDFLSVHEIMNTSGLLQS